MHRTLIILIVVRHCSGDVWCTATTIWTVPCSLELTSNRLTKQVRKLKFFCFFFFAIFSKMKQKELFLLVYFISSSRSFRHLKFGTLCIHWGGGGQTIFTVMRKNSTWMIQITFLLSQFDEGGIYSK